MTILVTCGAVLYIGGLCSKRTSKTFRLTRRASPNSRGVRTRRGTRGFARERGTGLRTRAAGDQMRNDGVVEGEGWLRAGGVVRGRRAVTWLCAAGW